MGGFLAVNGSFFVLLVLILLALIVPAASRCSAYLLRTVNHFFIAASEKPLTSLGGAHM